MNQFWESSIVISTIILTKQQIIKLKNQTNNNSKTDKFQTGLLSWDFIFVIYLFFKILIFGIPFCDTILIHLSDRKPEHKAKATEQHHMKRKEAKFFQEKGTDNPTKEI